MKAERFARRLLRALAVAAALFAAFAAAPARAGCGTIVTLNPTDHWVWITIYDLGELQHLDWGWVAPHSGRGWHAGGAPTPQSYACGSFYHVRYEVKQGIGGKEPPANAANLFDTRMEINPQLTLSDIVGLVHSLGTLITCAAPGVGTAGCVAEWGLDEAGSAALFGTIGSDSNGSVVCIKTGNGRDFWLESSGDCKLRPKPGDKPKVSPPWHPPKPVGAYQVLPSERKIGVGVNTRAWYFYVAKIGSSSSEDVAKLGRYYTDDPRIAKFDNEHVGRIRGVKKGSTMVHWEYKGNKASARVIVQ